MNANAVRCAALALTLFALIGLQQARADVTVEVSISQPFPFQVFTVATTGTKWVSAFSHHVASYTDKNINAAVLNLTINVEYQLTHSIH